MARISEKHGTATRSLIVVIVSFEVFEIIIL